MRWHIWADTEHHNDFQIMLIRHELPWNWNNKNACRFVHRVQCHYVMFRHYLLLYERRKKINSISDFMNFIHHLICAIVGRLPIEANMESNVRDEKKEKKYLRPTTNWDNVLWCVVTYDELNLLICIQLSIYYLISAMLRLLCAREQSNENEININKDKFDFSWNSSII